MFRRRGLVFGVVLMGMLASGVLLAQDDAVATVAEPAPGSAADPFGADWPVGEGRSITGAACITCHSLAIVKQQGLNRKRWDKLLDWMVEEHGMPVYPDDTRNTILDFLVQNFGYDDPSTEG
jgi:hypothetical protein